MKKAFLLILFCLFSALVQAETETIPSILTQDLPVQYDTPRGWVYRSALQGACETDIAIYAAQIGNSTVIFHALVESSGKFNCQRTFSTNPGALVYGLISYSPGCSVGKLTDLGKYDYVCRISTPSCPDSSWTLSADQKTCSRQKCAADEIRFEDGTCGKCPEGYNRTNDGVCIQCLEDTVWRVDLQMCVAPCHDRAKEGVVSLSMDLGRGFSDRRPPYVCLDACQYVAAGGNGMVASGFVCLKAIPKGQEDTAFCQWVASGLFQANGARCSITPGIHPEPGSDAPKEPESLGDQAAKCVAKGQGFGTVNGVIVCTGKEGVETDQRESGSSSENSSSEKTETKDKDGNVTDVTSSDKNSKTETKCVGDSCTSTTTSTGTGSDGSTTKTTDTTTCVGDKCSTEKTTETTDKDGNTTTTTETGEQPKNEFCKENPKHALCTANGEDKEPDFTIPKKGKFDGKSSEIEALQVQFGNKVAEIKGHLSGMFGTLSTGVGSLPCGERFNVLGQSINFCFSQYNDKLSIIGAVMILVAWVIAAGIVLWR